MSICYQCEVECNWLAPDSRCGKCTRFTPEEITGEYDLMEERSPRPDHDENEEDKND